VINLQMIVGLLSFQGRTEASAEAASRLAVAAKRVGAIAHLHRWVSSTTTAAC
jgi:two-component sensor histidine kinase